MKKFNKYLFNRLQKCYILILTRRKVKKLISSLRKSWNYTFIISKELKDKHKRLWSKFCLNVNFDWLKVYISVSGVSDFRYIPEDIYYSEVEPRLNNKVFSKAYTDKNNYHKLFDNGILPTILFRSINGIYYTQDYKTISKKEYLINNQQRDGKYIIKPSTEGGGGLNVRLLEFYSNEIRVTPPIKGVTSLTEIISFYKRDFLIQQYVEQHLFFKQFNASSLNTIRVLTYRSLIDENIIILHKILRIGKVGSIVDNQSAGGIACGIHNDGTLSSFGVDKHGNKYYESNSIRFSNVGIVPFLDSISSIANTIARKYLYSRLLGMDFAVDTSGKVLLIEVNDSNNEINFYQMNNGPLFGSYTEEIASLCPLEPKSFMFTFYLD